MTIFKKSTSSEMAELSNVKVLSDASAALRENYEPTNEVLGEGMFGKVFVFTSKL